MTSDDIPANTWKFLDVYLDILQTLVYVPTAFKRRFLKLLMKAFHINLSLLSFIWSIKLFIVDYKINNLNGFLINFHCLVTDILWVKMKRTRTQQISDQKRIPGPVLYVMCWNSYLNEFGWCFILNTYSACTLYLVNLATELFVLLHNGRYFSDQSRFA